MKKNLKQLLVSLTLILMPFGAWAQYDAPTDFGIWIGHWEGGFNQNQNFQYKFVGTKITSANASDVFGDTTVSYANGTLTLNGATINNHIYSKHDLTIDLEGDNFITPPDSCSIMGSFDKPFNMTIKSSTGTGRLTMEGKDTFKCIGGFDTPTLDDGLSSLLGGPDQKFAVIAYNLFSGGTGVADNDPYTDTDADDPYIISTVGDLILLSKCINHGELTQKYFKLNNDLDFDGVNGFEPIGTDTYPFVGLFNGNQKTISNLTCTTDANQAYTGLFGKVGIDNSNHNISFNTIVGMELYLRDCIFEGGEHTGAIAGYLDYATISNCILNNCTIKSGNFQNVSAGGIVGTVECGDVRNSIIDASNIYATTSSTVTSCTANAGGLVGTICCDRCYINGCRVFGSNINSSHAGASSVAAAGGLYGGVEGTGKSRSASWNEVREDNTIKSESSNDDATVYAGAIAGQKGDVALVGNYYWGKTNTSTKKGSAATVEKSGYTQRGVGDGDDVTENDGALIKTYNLTLPATYSYATYAPVAGTYAKVEANEVYVAPGLTAKVVITPKNDCVPATVTVTGNDYWNSNALYPTKADDSYTYSFQMPSYNATFNATFDDNTSKYNLWVGNTQVSEANYMDILGDGNPNKKVAASFTYNPKNRHLIVNSTAGYNIESQIDEGLTVYLAPRTENRLSSITYTGKSNAPLTITTDGNNPGKLTLENSNAATAAPMPVISGFGSLTLDKARNLAILDPEGIAYQSSQLNTTEATIGVPLMPMTRNTAIVPDGTKIVPNEGQNNINKVVDDVLYTLSDVNNANGDGFDDTENCIVINSITSDANASRAARDYVPQTTDFFNLLKGVTFMVPAGNGNISLNIQTAQGYVLKMKVGDAEPVTLQKSEKGEVEVRYNVGKPTYVYLYASKTGANARNIEKGGKKTLASTKIYGTSVKPSTVKSSNPVGPASDYKYTGDTSDMAGQTVMSDEMMAAAMGDVDGNGVKDAKDIVEIVKAMMGKHSPEYDETVADMNDDGIINTADIEIVVTTIP